MFKTMLLGAAAALTLAGGASAQETRSGARADRDADGRISLAEMQAVHAARFARLDVDRSGGLTREELRTGRQLMRAERSAVRGERQAERFSRRDVNRDGALNQAEAPKAWARLSQMDANRDARVTAEELRAGRQAKLAQRQAGRTIGGRVDGAGRTAAPADLDRDGLLTRAEYDARLLARFTRLDANRDGFVTREERRALRQARRGQA
jgi:hypothetical protein